MSSISSNGNVRYHVNFINSYIHVGLQQYVTLLDKVGIALLMKVFIRLCGHFHVDGLTILSYKFILIIL